MYTSSIVDRGFSGYEPPTENDPKEIEARRTFESYGADLQTAKIKTGISAVTGALAGVKAGPVGIILGAALGALAGYWKSMSYRSRVYAQLDALGLLRKPRVRQRGITYLRNQEFVLMRYPYAEQTALIIVPILRKHYPDLTVQELTEIGQNSQRALMKFRQANSDVPLSLAAEVVLAYYGIIRNAQGVYDLAYKPEPGSPTLGRIKIADGVYAPSPTEEKCIKLRYPWHWNIARAYFECGAQDILPTFPGALEGLNKVMRSSITTPMYEMLTTIYGFKPEPPPTDIPTDIPINHQPPPATTQISNTRFLWIGAAVIGATLLLRR